MPRTPRLTAADKADLAARHEVVTARVVASENISRKVIREPIEDATRHLVYSIAAENAEASSLKRAVYRGVSSLSDALSSAAANAVEVARGHARDLSLGQVGTDLASFVKKAQELGFPVLHPVVNLLPGVHVDQDGAISHQAGLSLAHRWSSQMLGNYSQWKREGGGVDGLIRRFQNASRGGLDNLIETQAITQSIDAYADQHAATWREIAGQAAGSALDSAGEDGIGWGAGLYDMWSATLDRGTCGDCFDLDGEMVPSGTEFPGVSRAPLHNRCRCEPLSIWIPEAALKKLPGAQLDYELLKQDVKEYARGSSLNIGEGRRHAQDFMRDALSGHSPSVLNAYMSQRRSYFPNLVGQRAPRLLF